MTKLRSSPSGKTVRPKDLAPSISWPAVVGSSDGNTFQSLPLGQGPGTVASGDDARFGASNLTGILKDSSSGNVSAIRFPAGASLAAGILDMIPSQVLLLDTNILPGTGKHILSTQVIGPSQKLTAVAVLNYSAGGLKTLTRTLTFTAKRVGNAAAVVTSSAAGYPSELTIASWDPKIALNGNSAELSLVADPVDVIVPHRATIEWQLTDMAADPANPLDASLDLILGPAVEDWDASNAVMSGVDVQRIIGRFGNDLTPEGVPRDHLTTLGPRPAVILPAPAVAMYRLISGALPAAPTAVMVVLDVPAMPFADYPTAVNIGSNAITFVGGVNATATLQSPGGGSSLYVDGVLTNVVTAGTHVIWSLAPANVSNVIGVGGHNGLTARAWVNAIGRVRVHASLPTNQQIIDSSAAALAAFL